MPSPTHLQLQQLLVLLAAGCAVAQFGQQQSAVVSEDFEFPEYAQPWAVGQNVCAYLRSSEGRRIYTTCFAYKQTICGEDSQFDYDCCPGYGHDASYEGYKTGRLWPRSENCLKTLTDSQMSSGSDTYLQRLGADTAIRQKLREDLPRTSGQVTVFMASNGTYDSAKFRSGSGQAAYIASGSYMAKQLLDGASLQLAGGTGAIKVTKYSSGIVCAECRRLMSANHPLDGRAVVHFTDGFVFGSRQSVAAVLQSQFSHFWADVPEPLRQQLGAGDCSSRWYTVLVPSAGAWTAAKRRLGASGDVGQLVREHVLPRLLCAAAVCSESVANENLNGETLKLGCDSLGVYAQAAHAFMRNSKVYVQQRSGERDAMATNGVVYQVDGAILHSAAFSINDVAWPGVSPACVRLQPGKKYIFLIPRTSAWSRFNNSDARINSAESMKQFSDLHAADADYRCLVKKYHVLEAEQPNLQRLWSQYNPGAWPADKQPGAFRTLARWPDARRSAYGFLNNHLHFQKADTGPRLHFQFAPVRQAEGFDLREGRGYMVDWVNIPPNETAADFFERRPDLASHKKLVDNEQRAARRGQSLYESEATVQLIIVSKEDWYSQKTRSDRSFKGVKNRYGAVSNTWNATDYLLLNWANLYYWIGDLGFMARGEKIFLQSGHPDLLLGVYRHITSGDFYVWNEFRDQSPEPMETVRRRWAQVVEFNHFKTDAMIWIVDKPMACSRRLCRRNLSGRTLLPWSFAAACGDFVALPTTKSPAVKPIFSAAANKMMQVVHENSPKRLDAGPNSGTDMPVSCYGVGMLMTRTFVLSDED